MKKQIFTPKRSTLLLALLSLTLSACTVGPDYQRPDVAQPANVQAAHNGGLALPKISNAVLPSDWWKAFNDPVLNQLEQRALKNGLDLQTAALRFAQARMNRSTVAAQRGVDINATSGANRQAMSENGSATRSLALLGGNNKDVLKQALASPFNLFQAGFDVSWEIDFWGRISRSIESADADIRQQEAMYQWAKLSLVSEVAQNYFELRNVQNQIAILQQEINSLGEKTALLTAKAGNQLSSQIDPVRQQSELDALKAQLPALQAQENGYIGQLATLLGEPSGSLNGLLTAQSAVEKLPDLSLGIPSEVAQRRPDVLAAEAKLQSATAQIGVAKAALYPSFRIGAKFGTEALSAGDLADWGSKSWSAGLSFDLPIFDHGRRVSTVKLRELQQQEAAVEYQKTTLKAWQEIDSALTQYAAAQAQIKALTQRLASAEQAHRLVQARQKHGLIDFTAVLDSQRSVLQAKQQLTTAKLNLNKQFVSINKAIGNVPTE